MIRLMLCSVLICTFAPALAPADDKTPDKNANVKTFDVPGHGGLRLSIPAGWTSKAALVLAGTSLAIFLLAFLFDSLLLWLAPEQFHLDS